MKAKTIIVLIMTILALIVIFQNTEVVAFQILFWQFSMSRIIWLLIMLLVGFITGYVVGTLKRAGDRSSGAMNKPEH